MDFVNIQSFYSIDGRNRLPIETKAVDEGDHLHVFIPKESVPAGTQYVDFLPGYFTAHEGEDGYLVFPNNFLTYFHGHADTVTGTGGPVLYFFGAKKEGQCFAAVLGGMKYDSAVIADVRDGIYRIYPRFKLEGDAPYEDLSVDYYPLTGADADYSGMARLYRRIRMERDGLRPYAERAKNNPALRYAASAPCIRIRMAWKPVPSPVPEQTRETEPPVHVACDCKRAGEFLDELQRQGVREAEICLVGWNVGGHDGRWPETLPVEPSIGGEEALRALIKKAQSMGYQIVCHTNSSDAYSIADCFDPDMVLMKKDGSLTIGGNWGGGRMYSTCPEATYPLSVKMLDEAASLGFRGIHYIDVVSIVAPRRCYNPNHPLNSAQTTEWYQKIFRYAAEKMGGISSEGGHDYMTDTLDYAFEVMYSGNRKNGLCDAYIPLWQLVYNGFILSNPCKETINATEQSVCERLEIIERNSRPTFYLNRNFITGTGSGNADLLIDTDEQLRETVSVIKHAYDEYSARRDLQYRFLDRHELVTETVRRSVFSDGTEIWVNYGESDYEGEVRVPALSSRVVRAAKRQRHPAVMFRRREAGSLPVRHIKQPKNRSHRAAVFRF